MNTLNIRNGAIMLRKIPLIERLAATLTLFNVSGLAMSGSTFWAVSRSWETPLLKSLTSCTVRPIDMIDDSREESMMSWISTFFSAS